MMKRATQTKQYAELDHAIRTKVEPFLYNKGKGAWIPIAKLVLLRNKERPRHKLVINFILQLYDSFIFLIHWFHIMENYLSIYFQLPVLKAMENPSDYDVTKEIDDSIVDGSKIGNFTNKILFYKFKFIRSNLKF